MATVLSRRRERTEARAGGLGRAAAATDEQLVRAALDGDRGAFERLVQRHQRGMVNHLYRLTGRHEAALDLAQDVFIKVYLSLDSFDPRYRFTTWLYRIASNRAIDHLRKKRPRLCSLTQRGDPEWRDAPEDRIAGTAPMPDELLQARELKDRLDDAVQALPPSYRELILLRHRRQCRYDEIARITSLPLGTVKNRIFRAREILRQELAGELAAEA